MSENTRLLPSCVIADEPLAPKTTIRIGGSAAYFARVDTLEQLHEVLAWAAERQLPVVPLGQGSNVLVADEGVEAVVTRLADEFRQFRVLGEGLVRVGAGTSNKVLAKRAQRAGLAGLEFAIGIPGTVGGSVRMNAGVSGGTFGDHLVRARVVTVDGADWRDRDAIAPGYRASAIRDSEVVVDVELQLEAGDPAAIEASMQGYEEARQRTQPVKRRTFGSVFINPSQDQGDLSLGEAWRVIRQCDAHELSVGKARVSQMHANFIENLGGATAADVVGLMATVRDTVYRKRGIVLKPEVIFIGEIGLPPLGKL